MRLRDAVPADLPVSARLIRSLADYKRLSHEVVWTDGELEASLCPPEHLFERTGTAGSSGPCSTGTFR